MKFELKSAIEVLRQTPHTLITMLDGLSPEWTASSGDPKNWAPYDIIGHLIHAEDTDWIPRAEIILAQGDDRTFEPFDRTAQFETHGKTSFGGLLAEFDRIRSVNLETLESWNLTPEQLQLKGVHPDFGEVTLEQLLATWVVHDLNHIRQVVTYMARKYDAAVGPWIEYLSILK